MTIHHATAKKASEQQITLTEQEGIDKPFVLATCKEGTHRGFEGEKASDVLADAIALRLIKAEYSELQPDRDDEGRWNCEFDDQAFMEDRLANLLDKIIEYAQENGVDISNEESEEAEEEGESHSVVPPKYRKEYAERGNPNHCGDWLAETLAPICGGTKKDPFNLDLFLAICDANDVDHSGYKREKPSDRGRLRMSCGNTLRKRCGATGVLVIPATGDADDTEIKVPERVRNSPRYAVKAKEAGDKKAAKRSKKS